MKHKPECKQCGECCKVFAVKHVVKTKPVIEYALVRGYTFDGSTMLIPSPCPHLQRSDAGMGEMEYLCDIYETRPQACRDYNGRSGKYYTPIGCVYRK